MKIEKELDEIKKIYEAFKTVDDCQCCVEYYEINKCCLNYVREEINKLSLLIRTIENMISDKEYLLKEEDD